MKREEIIEKLIENGIIEDGESINEDMERFISLERYYNIEEKNYGKNMIDLSNNYTKKIDI